MKKLIIAAAFVASTAFAGEPAAQAKPTATETKPAATKPAETKPAETAKTEATKPAPETQDAKKTASDTK